MNLGTENKVFWLIIGMWGCVGILNVIHMRRISMAIFVIGSLCNIFVMKKMSDGWRMSLIGWKESVKHNIELLEVIKKLGSKKNE